MKKDNLARLLRAASQAPEVAPNEMPFGFDTRVLAHWRGVANRNWTDLGSLVRRVIWLSVAVITLGAAGAYHELNQSDDLGDNLDDQYALADSAIGSVVEP